MEQLSLDQHSDRRFRLEQGALCATFGPLKPAAALSGVARQAGLGAPAKFAMTGSGVAVIQAEIPLVAERRVCEKLADEALDAAILWPRLAAGPPAPDRMAFAEDEIESGLSQISWGFHQSDVGSYQIDAAPAPGHAMRVTLVAQGGALRVSTGSSLRADSPDVHRALAVFALESNSRLRLARIGVAEKDGAADIVWEAVLPAALPAVGAIPQLVEAVVYAQVLTRSSLSVLTDARVADTYLRHRPAARARRRRRAEAGGRSSRQAMPSAPPLPVAERVPVVDESTAGQCVTVERSP